KELVTFRVPLAAATEPWAGSRQESPGQSGCAAVSAPPPPGCALDAPLPILDCPPLPDVDTRARSCIAVHPPVHAVPRQTAAPVYTLGCCGITASVRDYRKC